jgi:hypothetical protein
MFIHAVAFKSESISKSFAGDLVLDSAVLDNQVVNVLDIALIGLGNAVALNGLPGTEKLLLLYRKRVSVTDQICNLRCWL